MKNEILTVCGQLIAAAGNGTYQGIVLTVLVAASLKMLRRTNAATRCAVWFATLLILALIIPAHYLCRRWTAGVRPASVETSVPTLASSPPYSEPMRMEASFLPPEPDVEMEPLTANANFPENEAEANGGDDRRQRQQDLAAAAGTNNQPEDPARALVSAILEATASNQTESATPETGFLPGIKEKLRWLGERMLTPLPSWTVAPQAPLYVLVILPLCWLAIAGAKVSILVCQLFRIRKLKLNSFEPSPELNAVFLSLCNRVGVRRNVALKVSTEHKSPVVLGWFKPIILLPSDARLEDAEHVLRHELAHVRRYDDWSNLVQQSIKAVFFFHPAIWWVSKRISLEREIACDDEVLQATLRPKAYALLLAELAGRMQSWVLAPGVSTNQSQLKQRIDMILNSSRNTSPRLAKARLGLLATATALLALAAIYSAPRLALSQSADNAAPSAGLPPAASSAEAANAAPAPELSVSHEIAPPAPLKASSALAGEPTAEAGPKFKPGSTVSVNVRPAITPRPSVAIVTTAPPGSPSAGMTLVAPPVAAAPLVANVEPFTEPGQSAAPRAGHRPGRDPSLEERLDRLEKMVESLVAQQRGKPGQFEFTPKLPAGEMKLKDHPEPGKQWEHAQADYGKTMAELNLKRADADKRLAELEKLKNLNDPKIAKELKELAEQHAKMAVDQEKTARQAEQAAREAQKAARDAQRGRTMPKMRDGSPHELEALHKQHEMLERQMEELDRQIEKLERGQEKFEEQQESDEQENDVQLNQNERQKRLDGLSHNRVNF